MDSAADVFYGLSKFLVFIFLMKYSVTKWRQSRVIKNSYDGNFASFKDFEKNDNATK